MIGRPPGRLRIDPNEPKISQIEPADKNVNDTNRIVLVDPILQAFRKQRALSSILALNEALHLIPRITRGNPNSRIKPDAAFSHSLGQTWPRRHLPGARTRGRCSPARGPIRGGWIVAALGLVWTAPGWQERAAVG